MSGKIQLKCHNIGRCDFAATDEWSTPLDSKEDFVCRCKTCDRAKCLRELEERPYLPPRRWPKVVGILLLVAGLAAGGVYGAGAAKRHAEEERLAKEKEGRLQAEAADRERLEAIETLKKAQGESSRQQDLLAERGRDATKREAAARAAEQALAEQQARIDRERTLSSAAAAERKQRLNNPTETWFRLGVPSSLAPEGEILVAEFLKSQKLQDVQVNQDLLPGSAGKVLVEGIRPGAEEYSAVEIYELKAAELSGEKPWEKVDAMLVARADRFSGKSASNRDTDLEKRFAKDGYAVVVNPANGVGPLTLAQIKDILERKVTNWEPLQDEGGEIHLHLPAEASASRAMLDDVLSASGQLTLARAAGGAGHEDDQAVADAIFSDRGGFGLVPRRRLRQTRGLDLRLGDVGKYVNVPFTEFAIATGSYRFTQTLYVRWAPNLKNAVVPGFVQFLRSEEGQDAVVNSAGLVDLRVQPLAVKLPEVYLGVIPKDVLDSINLATTEKFPAVFRFATDNSDQPKGVSTDSALASDSRDSLEKIVSFLFRPENREKVILLFGHADDTGTFAHNAELSRNRGANIEGKFLSGLVRNRIVMIGLGSQVPDAENSTEEGRAINRRVEIWTVDKKK